MRNLYLSILAAAALLTGFNAHAQLLTQSNFEGQIVPRYMATATTSGTSGDSTRVPVLYLAKLTGLQASTQYRYLAQGATTRDFGKAQIGAGLPLFINYGGSFLVVSIGNLANPSLSSSFTTDATGTYTGWFGFVPSTNARFSADTLIYPSIALKAQSGSDTGTRRYVLDQTIKVLSTSSTAGANGASAIRGTSLATPKNIIGLYDGSGGRPVAVTIAEAVGGTNWQRQPTWYFGNVRGTAGSWGTFIPNNLPTGIRMIEQYDMTGTVVGNNTSADGIWGSANTVNPSGGTSNQIVITSAVAPLNGATAVKGKMKDAIRVWSNSDRQELQILTDESSSLRICSLTGQTVARLNVVRGQQTSVSTQGWSKGLYILVDERSNRTVRTVVR